MSGLPTGAEKRRAVSNLPHGAEKRRAVSNLPTGVDKRRAVREMFDAIAPRYDLVNRIMTLRLDVAWRRRTGRELALPAGSLVADLACGTGDLCRELARRGHRPPRLRLLDGNAAGGPRRTR